MATVDDVAAALAALQSDFDALHVKLMRQYGFVVDTLVDAPASSTGLSGEGTYVPPTPASLGAPYQDILGWKISLATVPITYGRSGTAKLSYYRIGYVMARDTNGLWTPPIKVETFGQGIYLAKAGGERIYYNMAPGVVIDIATVYTRSDQP